MKQPLNHVTESPVGSLYGHSGLRAHWVGVVLAAGMLACSEGAPPSTSVPNGGSGGQATGGAGGSGVVAGSAGVTSGGMPPAAGAAGGGASAGGSGGASGGGAGGASGSGGAGGSGGADEGWVPLFNGTNLEGWTPSAGAADLFAVSQLEGEGVLHVYPTQADQSDQPMASLRTNDSFGSYVFHLQYKWGTARYSDRKQTARDNGICFHICNDPAQVWPESLELQIGSQEWPGDWVTGNIFMLINKTRAQWPFTMMNNQEVWSATGTKKSIGAPASYYKGLVQTQLNIDDDWNTIELTVNGSEKAEYKVNGTVVNELFDMECNVGGTWAPLEQGPIALQAEWAEVYFRDIRIKMLP